MFVAANSKVIDSKKLVIILVLVVLVVLLVAWTGDEHIPLARAFVRNLLRHVF